MSDWLGPDFRHGGVHWYHCGLLPSTTSCSCDIKAAIVNQNQAHTIRPIQWNPSNVDTNGAEGSVLYREVSLFQGLKCMQEWYLGWEKVSLLERCPQFRGVLIEGFHCTNQLHTTFGGLKMN